MNYKKYLAVIFLSFAYFGVLMMAYTDREPTAAELSGKLIRLHVVANSDSPQDQSLKLMVRDQVLKTLEPRLNATENVDEAREILRENLRDIEIEAERILGERGSDKEVTACIEYRTFPKKAYGPITLPAGEYEALDIKIGQAQGKNWWCIMFPPLCFTDAVTKEDNEKLREEYNKAVKDKEYKSDIKIKFKIKELFDEWRKK